MGIDWARFGTELKRRRERTGMTQDALAAKVGVRLATIGRLEIGDRRPSIDLLERLAAALRCRVVALLREEDRMQTEALHQPSLRGAPTYFRAAVFDARNRNPMASDIDTGSGIRDKYLNAGWSLGIHLSDHLSEAAYEYLAVICRETDPAVFKRKLLALLELELPGCMALVPSRRRDALLVGISKAISDGRLDFGSVAADRIAGD